jgi:hypothetical protein
MYQPIQVVYYPPAPIPRMTTKQLLSYALIIGISTFGITALLTTIIKVNGFLLVSIYKILKLSNKWIHIEIHVSST